MTKVVEGGRSGGNHCCNRSGKACNPGKEEKASPPVLLTTAACDLPSLRQTWKRMCLREQQRRPADACNRLQADTDH
ncbi:hypothetical protein TYRP_010962 [Tyrophagus putrescentiae]|nr:hypothetical protein TYRP_010962 [Tyrophagus putrescentiae]